MLTKDFAKGGSLGLLQGLELWNNPDLFLSNDYCRSHPSHRYRSFRRHWSRIRRFPRCSTKQVSHLAWPEMSGNLLHPI